jgi:hypothetical protein
MMLLNQTRVEKAVLRRIRLGLWLCVRLRPQGKWQLIARAVAAERSDETRHARGAVLGASIVALASADARAQAIATRCRNGRGFSVFRDSP